MPWSLKRMYERFTIFKKNRWVLQTRWDRQNDSHSGMPWSLKSMNELFVRIKMKKDNTGCSNHVEQKSQKGVKFDDTTIATTYVNVVRAHQNKKKSLYAATSLCRNYKIEWNSVLLLSLTRIYMRFAITDTKKQTLDAAISLCKNYTNA